MITGVGFTHKKFNFPCGDTHVQVTKTDRWMYPVHITWEYENDGEIMELLLLCDALRQMRLEIKSLSIPYVPFSRQDRVINQGEPFSIKVFAGLINNLNIPTIYIDDPHSDVTPALINNAVISSQRDIFEYILMKKYPSHNFLLVSPDAGAAKKIYKVAQGWNPHDVIECSKIRNTKTGEIEGIMIPENYFPLIGKMDFVIIDDICDGGQTFIKLATELRYYGVQRIVLMVTHGFFTKGLGVFDEIIDEIYTRKGKVK